MKKLLLYLWQLPQHLLALIMIFALRAKRLAPNVRSYIFRRTTFSCFSLGDYIFMNDEQQSFATWNHERGHTLQSHILGPLYLLVIGLPSVIGNLLRRFISFDYYKQPWEAWADRLGGVIRSSAN